ncbi:MAG: MoaD/ThiS family protein [Candidatus Methylacidiphilales bacterium]|nr:MoaD/ThiS family protein [Candidatus Methylacidiphilales bacterium]
MPLQVSIPTPLRNLTNNKDTVEATGATIGEVIADLDSKYPSISERLLDKKTGRIQRFVNIYVNGENVRFMEDKDTPVTEKDEIFIEPAIAGG